jgi:HAD superfamily hydrolase (TIGR01509 family)
MSISPPKLVIFDCDGVLVDSETLANQALVVALAAEGWSLTEAECRALFVGLSLRSVLTVIEERLGRSLAPDWAERLQTETYARFRGALREVPGAALALRTVAAAGIASCVASSGTHDKLALTLGLTGLTPLVEGRVFSASEVARGKPHPDLFLHAARRMGVLAEYTVVVEDSAPGVEAAVAAGMGVLGFARETPEAVLAARGARVFHALSELPGLLGIAAL